MSYQLEVSAVVQRELKKLPGNVRQRLRRAIWDLADNPRPPESRRLDFTLLDYEPRRLRLDLWRIIHVITEAEVKRVKVLAVHRRPPYQYNDLAQLFSGLN